MVIKMKTGKLKRFLFLVLAMSLLLCGTVCAGAAQAAGQSSDPLIAITFVPVYNENAFVQGKVYRPDGGAIDARQYRISLYLQVVEGEGYWVKPTYDHPYASVAEEDGSFSIRYASGGHDLEAEVLHVMLIPSSYTPDNNFSATRAQALDYVKITRSSDGSFQVEPDFRYQPYPIESPSPVPFSASADKIAFDIGFHTDGSYPGSSLSENLIRRHLSAIQPYCDVVRFYSASDEVNQAYAIAHEMGFQVIGSAWLSTDKNANKRELDAIIELANRSDTGICLVVVGSETLLRGDLSASELVEAIRYVRDGLNDKTLPVTTADSFHILAENPSVIDACNVLMANCYPYWGGASIEDAQANFTGSIASLAAVSRDKPIIISETGWPTAGQTVGSAIAGEDEAARYYEIVRKWSLATGTNVLYFSSVDEPWKAGSEGSAGAHWGFFTTDFQLKPCYAGLNPFGSGGVYGDNIAWSLSDGELTLCPVEDAENGEMLALPEGDGWEAYPWASFAGQIHSIVIEEGVSSVAALAFGGDGETAPYSAVTELTLAESVTELGDGAFSGCPALCAVIPATVTEIGDVVFAGCENVRFLFPQPDAVLPAEITRLEASAFENTGFSCVWIPDGCEQLGEQAFASSASLRRIRVPASVTEIASESFAGCELVYIYGEPGSAADLFCADPEHANCRFLPLAPSDAN